MEPVNLVRSQFKFLNLSVISPSSVSLLHRTFEHLSPAFLVSEPYSEQGVHRGCQVRGSAISCTVGIICDVWPSWLFGFLHESFDVLWVGIQDDVWIPFLRVCFPHITFLHLSGDVTLACPQIVAVSDHLDSFIDRFRTSQIILCSWEAKCRRLRLWRSVVWNVEHRLCGGVSDLVNTLKCFLHPDLKEHFQFNPETLIRKVPLCSLSTLLDSKVNGSILTHPPRLPVLDVPAVSQVNGSSVYHYKGLFPSKADRPEFFVPCVFSPSKWVRRELQPFELLRVFDIPVQVEKRLSHRKSKLLLPLLTIPCKSIIALTHGLFLASPASEVLPLKSSSLEANVLAGVNGGGLSSPSSLPIAWNHNVSHNRDERAAKSDDAEVPFHLWHNHLASLLGKQSLTIKEIHAINKIRIFMLKFWVKSLQPCFIDWLRCKRCHNDRMIKRFEGCFLYSNYTVDHSNYCQDTTPKDVNSMVYWNGSKFMWRKKGRMAYRKYWELVLKGNCKADRLDIQESIEAFLECVTKARKCTEWKWDGGSRTFFWRWGEHWKDSRDGAKVHIKGPLPRCRDKQSVPKDNMVKEKMLEKLRDVRSKGYITKGEVKSLTSFFAVPKSDDDIRMVYNGTSSGLNDAVWAPWFALPTVDTHLRSTIPNTYMCDIDLSEMFLNFMLDKDLRAYAGVDFSKLFKEEIEKGGTLWECWVRMLMGFKPSPYLTTREMRRVEEFLMGDVTNENNVFRWKTVVFNLPGSKNYDPSMPRVYRIRVEGTMAGDLFIYIDDLRVTAPSHSDCWTGAHQVCCRLTWLGLQDAPRKRSEVSKTPRAWAGSIVHSDNNTVSVLIAEKKWAKAKKWLDWMHGCLESSSLLNHKELERCRGFLIYVSRTYKSMRPYLRGIHMTIENWRPNRDEEGWKLINSHKDDVDPDMTFQKNSTHSSSEFVKPVPRLQNDVNMLRKLLRAEAPPKVKRRRSKFGKAFYGIGDASGGGFGYAVDVDGRLYDEYGSWNSAISEQSSNYRELRNLKNAVQRLALEGVLSDAELYLFTDNYVAERAYYNGGSSNSKHLDALVFELWDLQMYHDFDLYVYHIAGTRMIESGVDGLSRGDKSEGVAKGLAVLDFIPIHLTPFERSPTLKDWIYSWWNPETTLGELKHLSAEDWFLDYNKKGCFLWDVAPTAGETAVEQLCAHTHAQPYSNHIFLIPRLCTSHWRKQLLKVCDIVLTIKVDSPFWPSHLHEPLLMGIYFSLLPPYTRFAPWRFKYTQWLEDRRCKMQKMQSEGHTLDGNHLWQLFSETRKISTMQKKLARKMLSPKTS